MEYVPKGGKSAGLSERRAAEPRGHGGADGPWRSVSGVFQLTSLGAGAHREAFRKHPCYCHGQPPPLARASPSVLCGELPGTTSGVYCPCLMVMMLRALDVLLGPHGQSGVGHPLVRPSGHSCS